MKTQIEQQLEDINRNLADLCSSMGVLIKTLRQKEDVSSGWWMVEIDRATREHGDTLKTHTLQLEKLSSWKSYHSEQISSCFRIQRQLDERIQALEKIVEPNKK